MSDGPLTLRQTATYGVFKGEVNRKLDNAGQHVPALNALKNNPNFQQGLDNFAADFARQPQSARNPGKALLGAASQNVGKAIGAGSNAIAEAKTENRRSTPKPPSKPSVKPPKK